MVGGSQPEALARGRSEAEATAGLVWVPAVTGAERRIGQPRGINWARARRVGGADELSLRGESARMDACADKAQLGSGPMPAAGWALALA